MLAITAKYHVGKLSFCFAKTLTNNNWYTECVDVDFTYTVVCNVLRMSLIYLICV